MGDKRFDDKFYLCALDTWLNAGLVPMVRYGVRNFGERLAGSSDENVRNSYAKQLAVFDEMARTEEQFGIGAALNLENRLIKTMRSGKNIHGKPLIPYNEIDNAIRAQKRRPGYVDI